MIANLITLSRLVFTPFIVYMLYLGWNIHPAMLFTAAALTDWLDGRVARNYNMQTEFGKLFDPLVDRLLIASTIVALYVFRGTPPFWSIVLLLARDVILILGGQRIYKKTGERIEINFTGKLGTAILMTSLVLLILGLKLAISLFFVGLAVSIIAAIHYIKTSFSYDKIKLRA